MTEIQLLNRKPAVEKTGGFSIKIIVLWVLGIISAFGISWFLKDFFESSNWNALILASVLTFVFLVLFLLQTIFTKEKKVSAFIIFLESAAMAAIFMTKSFAISAFIPIVFLIFFWGYRRGRKILDNGLKIDFWGTSRVVLSKGVVAAAILAGGILPFYLNTTDAKFPVSPFLFEELVDSGSFAINKFLPGFNASSTIEEIALENSKNQLNRMVGAYSLPKETKQEIINEGMEAFYDNISNALGIEVDPKLNIPESLYNVSKNWFLGLTDKEKRMFFAGFGIFVFLTIEAISWPLRIIISIFAFIIYEILIALGFASIEFEARSKEVLTI